MIHENPKVLPEKVEKILVRELVRGLTCKMPLCCVLDYAMFHARLKNPPRDLNHEIDSIVGHTGFSIVFAESANSLWQIVEILDDGTTRVLKPKDDDFIVFWSTNDEYRPCRSCMMRMIETGTAEWHTADSLRGLRGEGRLKYSKPALHLMRKDT